MRLVRLLAALGLVLLLVMATAACGGDDAAESPDAAGGEGGEGADEADGSSAADGGTDSPAGDPADDPETDGGEAPAVDPSIEVPEWVEVVGVEEALNVRAGPNSSFERVAQIPPGETLRVLGGAESDEGGLWLLVVFGGDREGWVFSRYTDEIARPTPTPLPTPTPIGTPTPLPVGGDDDGSDDGDGGQTLRVVAGELAK